MALVSRLRQSLITRRLNKLYSNRPAEVDPALHNAQLTSLSPFEYPDK